MPDDGVNRILQEVIGAQRHPEQVQLGIVVAFLQQHDACLGLTLGDDFVLLTGLVETAFQCLGGACMQVVEQGGLPRIPTRRIGPAHVGDSQQIQIVEADPGADHVREFLDDLRVVDVLVLCGVRHHEMLAHQPGHQFGIEGREVVPQAERVRVLGAEFRMVAAAALGDVVEQAGKIQQLRLGQLCVHLVAARAFVDMSLEGEATHVADHHQDMFVHRIHMKQIELHQAGDGMECRQIARQNAVSVHTSRSVGQAVALAEYLDEQCPGADVVAQPSVDQVAMSAYEANGAGAHTLQLRVLLQQQEHLQHGQREACERPRVHDLEIAVAGLEAAIDGHRFTELVVQQDGLFEQLQQHFVEPLHLDHAPVVVLHELFDRQVGSGIGVTELVGECALMFEQQAILMPAGQQVQGVAHAPQMLFAALELTVFAVVQKAMLDQRRHGVDAEMALGDPANGLDIAQPTRTFLQVGFKVLAAVVELGVAHPLFLDLGGEECGGWPDMLRAGRLAEQVEELRVTGQQP